MIEKYLMIIGSSILVLLGSLHLYYTFFTDKFMSKQIKTFELMKQDSPILTKETTMWKAWIGFNASHSLGAIFIGLVNIIISLECFEFYQKSCGLLLLNNLTICFFLFLAKKYWFKVPLIGVLISAFCFTIASIIIWT